jgi:glycosyltransferase involved in cell wall biosynthesis
MTPSITCLMAVYNGDPWLRDSVNSILAQSFHDFELLIVNDGSTDGTLETARELSRLDPRIRIFDKENTGLASSLNYGLQYARGQWIARIDVDDICHVDRLLSQIRLASTDPDLVLIGSYFNTIDANSFVLKTYKPPVSSIRLKNILLNSSPPFPHSSVLFRLACVRDLGGYRSRVYRAEDHDLWLRLSQCGSFTVVPKVLVSIRKHDTNVSLHNGGLSQTIDSCMAMVSHRIRIYGANDPIDSTEGQVYLTYYSWIRSQLLHYGVLDWVQLSNHIKELRSSSPSFVSFFFGLIVVSFSYPLGVIGFVCTRFFPQQLFNSIASKWISLNL